MRSFVPTTFAAPGNRSLSGPVSEPVSSLFLPPLPLVTKIHHIINPWDKEKNTTKNRDTHSPATQEVTASPAARHAAGSLSLFLQAMNASFTDAQVTATCFDAAMSTAETGGGEEDEEEVEGASLILIGGKGGASERESEE